MSEAGTADIADDPKRTPPRIRQVNHGALLVVFVRYHTSRHSPGKTLETRRGTSEGAG